MDPIECATYAARCAAAQYREAENARALALGVLAVIMAASVGRLAAHGWHAVAERAGMRREALRGYVAYFVAMLAVMSAFGAGVILGRLA